MHLYAVTGQRSKALMQYEKCRQVLMDELGVEPGVETGQVYELIHSSSLSDLIDRRDQLIAAMVHRRPDLRVQSTARQAPAIPSNLPSIPTDFFGRSSELHQLHQVLMDQKSRQVTITGPGGIGKTRLAIEFARQIIAREAEIGSDNDSSQSHFKDGIFFISLESIHPGESILPAVAEVVGLRLDHGEQQLHSYLRDRKMLLILDNLEHLLQNVESITLLPRSSPGVHILATSREKLNLFGEQVLPLQGLEFSPGNSASLADFPAARLFLNSAQRQDPNFSILDADLKYLSMICQLVEGMPLALELSASWTNALPLASIAEHLKNDLQILSTNMAGLPDRHRSLRAVIAGSFSLLDQPEQDLFLKVAVFEAGFTLQAAQEVTGAQPGQLADLIDKSLLRYSTSLKRYSLHPLLKQYGLEKLTSNQNLYKDVKINHSEYFCKWFSDQSQPEASTTYGQKACLDAMSADYENTLVAWKWAIHNRDLQHLYDKHNSLGYYNIYRGGYLEGRRIFQSLIDAFPDLDYSGEPHLLLLRASLSSWLAFFLDILGDSSEAHAQIQISSKILELQALKSFDTRSARAHNLMISARIQMSRNNESRMDMVMQALELYQQVNHPLGTPFGLTTSARYAIFENQLRDAEDYLKDSLAIYNRTGNDIGKSVSLAGLGNHAFACNNYSVAKDYFHESIRIARDFNSPERIIPASLFLGSAHIFSGQFTIARRTIEIALEESKERGLAGLQAYSEYYMGYTLLHLGDYQLARSRGESALPVAENTGDLEMHSQISALLAAVDLAQGNIKQALDRFIAAQANIIDNKYITTIFGEDCGLFGLACALLQNGDTSRSRKILNDYLHQAMEYERVDKAMFAVLGFSRLLIELGEIADAVKLFRFTSGLPFVRNSRWFEDVHIAPIRDRFLGNNDGWNDQYSPIDIWDICEQVDTKYGI
jgi:predicted ATPase